MPSERPSRTDARRGSKPLVEKRRRARINRGLAQLQALVLDGKKEGVRQSRVEKADILEMAVRHVQVLQQQNRAVSASADASVLNKFQAGYSECMEEVSRFLERCQGLDTVRSRLDQHLHTCLKVVQDTSKAMTTTTTTTSSNDILEEVRTRGVSLRNMATFMVPTSSSYRSSIFSEDEDDDNESSSASSGRASSSPDAMMLRNEDHPVVKDPQDIMYEVGGVWRPW